MSNLEGQLWSIAEDTAVAFGFSFASDCEGLLRDMISQGASRLESEGFSEDEDKISLTKVKTALFVTAMVAEAKRLQLPELHEPTFHAAFQRLCPIWPFC